MCIFFSHNFMMLLLLFFSFFSFSIDRDRKVAICLCAFGAYNSNGERERVHKLVFPMHVDFCRLSMFSCFVLPTGCCFLARRKRERERKRLKKTNNYY